ncbi:MAG: UbiA family prenyltransferase [Planctomycetia bacterium]|nr:UbiA family prenyltransferase [Planctomycetia bacterium]
MSQSAETPGANLQAWLQLFRLPNLFTAMADVFLGYLLVHESLQPWWTFALLLGASSLMYTAGMVLNDVFDVAIDREERPARPIPSGRVPLALALHTGGVMLGAGTALSWAASALAGEARTGLVGTSLAIAVLAYDRLLKRTLIAPVAMGACRFLNVLLGASTAAGPWHAMHWLVAGGVGLYVVGVTWFARTEARESRALHLLAATAVMAAGLALLAWFPSRADARLDPVSAPDYAVAIGARWYVLWGALGFLTLWRCVAAALNPRPLHVQMAVRQCILAIVIIDAAACFAVRDLSWAAVILVLLAPAMFLGRWIYST